MKFFFLANDQCSTMPKGESNTNVYYIKYEKIISNPKQIPKRTEIIR